MLGWTQGCFPTLVILFRSVNLLSVYITEPVLVRSAGNLVSLRFLQLPFPQIENFPEILTLKIIIYCHFFLPIHYLKKKKKQKRKKFKKKREKDKVFLKYSLLYSSRWGLICFSIYFFSSLMYSCSLFFPVFSLLHPT